MAEKKSFVHYVAEQKTEYKYVAKFAVQDMTKEMIDCLEASLKKYELKSASAFRKTPIQESPLDFPNVKNTPVFTCDLSLGYPASLDFLRTYICNEMGISAALVAIYSEHDPRQIETDLYVDRTSPEYKKKYKARLGSEYEQTENVPEYGEAYNIGFLQELEKVRKERNITIIDGKLSPKEVIDHSTLSKDYDGFNDEKNLKKDTVGFFGRIKLPNLSKGTT